MYWSGATTSTTGGGSPTDTGNFVVTLDQVPRWTDAENRLSLGYDNDDPSFSNSYFCDPLTSINEEENSGNGVVSRFPVDHEINSTIYLWRGNPWNLEVDAVVNSTNEVSLKHLPFIRLLNEKLNLERNNVLFTLMHPCEVWSYIMCKVKFDKKNCCHFCSWRYTM